ncbi:hypothetical protein Q1695_001692 [Nippostrongylus brasiliensis]|nr:hypothetical protein Q1695_001692 [Nippostrongylus brasiliensis]
MNTFPLLLLFGIAATSAWAAVREKRQGTVVERTVINNFGARPGFGNPYGSNGFAYGNRSPYAPYGGGFNNGWGNPAPQPWGYNGFNRGPYGEQRRSDQNDSLACITHTDLVVVCMVPDHLAADLMDHMEEEVMDSVEDLPQSSREL